jgi:hypothetical protein
MFWKAISYAPFYSSLQLFIGRANKIALETSIISPMVKVNSFQFFLQKVISDASV